MFFEDRKTIINIVKKNNFTIIADDPGVIKTILQRQFNKNIFFLSPDEKTGKISIEQTRNFISMTDTKEKTDKYFVVLCSDTMNEASENAILKSVEEPKENHHFIFVTKTPSGHLQTILSRAQIFYKKDKKLINSPIDCDEKVKTYAKQLISADTKTLLALSNELSKKKDNARLYAQKIVEVAIEILYKSYLTTNQEKFLKKLPNLLKLYDNLSKNGHIKLHLVADMI